MFSYEGSLNCHECDDKMKEERGCKAEGIVPFYIGNERVMRCPITFVSNLTWQYIKAYNFYEKSMLPNGAGWNNESNKFIQAMMVLESEYGKMNKRDKKRR